MGGFALGSVAKGERERSNLHIQRHSSRCSGLGAFYILLKWTWWSSVRSSKSYLLLLYVGKVKSYNFMGPSNVSSHFQIVCCFSPQHNIFPLCNSKNCPHFELKLLEDEGIQGRNHCSRKGTLLSAFCSCPPLSKAAIPQLGGLQKHRA